MHRRLFLTAFAFILTPALARADDDPKSIVEQLYKLSAGKDGKYRGESAFLKPAVEKRWYSSALLSALAAVKRKEAKSGDVILDFDPITNSQGPSVNKLAISVENQTDAAATVLAQFLADDDKDPQMVRYIFTLEAGAWKLDNMRGEHGGKDK